MRAVVLTDGDANALTGGSLYHRRIAERARVHGVEVAVRSLSDGRPADLVRGADVVVVDSIVASRVRPRELGRRAVASVHQRPGGLVGSAAGRLARAALDLRCYRAVDAVVVPSALLARMLARAGIPRRRVRVVEPGVDGPAGRADGGRRTGGSPAGVAFVSIGNLSWHKRPLDLLEAFSGLADAGARLTLVGAAADPVLAGHVRERLRSPDLRDRAGWVGGLPPDAVARLLRAADVFVLPALHEAFGIAVGEAMRAGLPAIVSASGNLPRLVRDGVDGFVVPPRDVWALAAAMRRLATDRELRERMASSARARGASLSTWDQAARRFVAVLAGAARISPAAAQASPACLPAAGGGNPAE